MDVDLDMRVGMAADDVPRLDLGGEAGIRIMKDVFRGDVDSVFDADADVDASDWGVVQMGGSCLRAMSDALGVLTISIGETIFRGGDGDGGIWDEAELEAVF